MKKAINAGQRQEVDDSHLRFIYYWSKGRQFIFTVYLLLIHSDRKGLYWLKQENFWQIHLETEERRKKPNNETEQHYMTNYESVELLELVTETLNIYKITNTELKDEEILSKTWNLINSNQNWNRNLFGSRSGMVNSRSESRWIDHYFDILQIWPWRMKHGGNVE